MCKSAQKVAKPAGKGFPNWFKGLAMGKPTVVSKPTVVKGKGQGSQPKASTVKLFGQGSNKRGETWAEKTAFSRR